MCVLTDTYWFSDAELQSDSRWIVGSRWIIFPFGAAVGPEIHTSHYIVPVGC